MRRMCLSLCALALSYTFTPVQADEQQLEISVVTELGRSETSDALIFHSGFFWTTNYVHSPESTDAIELYDGSGSKLLGRLDLGHSPKSIFPYGNNAVAVVGSRQDPLSSSLSVVSWNGRSLSKRTYNLPRQYLFTRATSDAAGTTYLSHPGSREVIRWRAGSVNRVAQEISRPGELTAIGTDLWVLELGAPAIADDRVWAINTITGTTQKLFQDKPRFKLQNILALADQGLVAVTEAGADNPGVLFIDTETKELVANIPAKGEPRGIVRYGECVVTTNSTFKTLNFIKTSDHSFEVVDTWDISAAGDRLKFPSMTAINTDQDVFLVRSAYPCGGGCSVTQSSVFRVKAVGESKVRAACLGR